MPNANTPHSRQLRRDTATARRVRLIAEGWRQVNLLLPPDTVARLERLAADYPGGKAALVAEALRRIEESGA